MKQNKKVKFSDIFNTNSDMVIINPNSKDTWENTVYCGKCGTANKSIAYNCRKCGAYLQ